MVKKFYLRVWRSAFFFVKFIPPTHFNMPYTLGIKINGTCITDDDTKIIALLLYGLTRAKIGQVIFINSRCMDNKISALYGHLGIVEHCINALMREALKNGFDHYGFVNGKDVLSPDERMRLKVIAPHLFNETSKLVVTCLPV